MAERKSDLAFAAFFGSGKSGGGGGGGSVISVNGKTGNVTLNADDVGALPADTPIPAAVTEQTVSGWGFTKNTGTYTKPSGGIPKTDLASAVQTSLGKADTALQSVPNTYRTAAAQDLIDEAQDARINQKADASALNGKVSVLQGKANAGKFLIVGSDGNVAPVAMTAWQGGSY